MRIPVVPVDPVPKHDSIESRENEIRETKKTPQRVGRIVFSLKRESRDVRELLRVSAAFGVFP
jgi:hypothetical protein